MAMRRRLIPDPSGAVTAVSASGVTMTQGNDSCHSNLDTWAGPWGPDTMVEQFGNGRATLNSLDKTCGRNLVGKMKNGR